MQKKIIIIGLITICTLIGITIANVSLRESRIRYVQGAVGENMNIALKKLGNPTSITLKTAHPKSFEEINVGPDGIPLTSDDFHRPSTTCKDPMLLITFDGNTLFLEDQVSIVIDTNEKICEVSRYGL